ncbi:hypothetical protein V8Z79_14270 [Pantoea dispersa]|uniref:hypothetical protein n=1 Tax=Pantoea dispersa TaxID=59814 RepID=UPI0030CED41F
MWIVIINIGSHVLLGQRMDFLTLLVPKQPDRLQVICPALRLLSILPFGARQNQGDVFILALHLKLCVQSCPKGLTPLILQLHLSTFGGVIKSHLVCYFKNAPVKGTASGLNLTRHLNLAGENRFYLLISEA